MFARFVLHLRSVNSKNPMLKFSLSTCFVFCVSIAQAQFSYPDSSWFEANKIYLKIGINQDGIYRLSGIEITQAGLPSLTNLQLIHHGRVVAIKTVGETNGQLTADGYVEFYAEKTRVRSTRSFIILKKKGPTLIKVCFPTRLHIF
jgi:hypothetical protein